MLVVLLDRSAVLYKVDLFQELILAIRDTVQEGIAVELLPKLLLQLQLLQLHQHLLQFTQLSQLSQHPLRLPQLFQHPLRLPLLSQHPLQLPQHHHPTIDRINKP